MRGGRTAGGGGAGNRHWSWPSNPPDSFHTLHSTRFFSYSHTLHDVCALSVDLMRTSWYVILMKRKYYQQYDRWYSGVSIFNIQPLQFTIQDGPIDGLIPLCFYNQTNRQNIIYVLPKSLWGVTCTLRYDRTVCIGFGGADMQACFTSSVTIHLSMLLVRSLYNSKFIFISIVMFEHFLEVFANFTKCLEFLNG